MATVVHKIDSENDYWNAIQEARSVLAGGGLVGFPTETVYGVGANAADAGAVARLREIKRRGAPKPFTVHIGSRSAVERFVPGLGGIGRRLVDKAWPGPLTVIFPVEDVAAAPVMRDTATAQAAAMYHEGTVGIRYPDDRAACDLLNDARIPVVAASANRAGEPAPVDAEQVLAGLGGHIDVLLDAGRTRYGKPSTIVRINGTGFELVREGVIDARTLRRLASVSFLLVCSGNTCRSPMAEGLLRQLLAERLGCAPQELAERGYHVESAGTAAASGTPVSSSAAGVLTAHGIDIAGHRSQPLTLELLSRADYVFTMTDAQLDAVAGLSGQARARAQRLADEDIEDPMGGGDAAYEECARRMESALRRKLEEISL